MVALLTDDVWVRAPPVPLEYQGRELAARFLAAVSFRQGRTYRLAATRANGQPAPSRNRGLTAIAARRPSG